MFDTRISYKTSESDLTDSELTQEVCSQAAHLAVQECHFVLLLAEFDRRELWVDGVCRSCAHWLNWRCGTSIGTAREQVRVGRALEHLPGVRDAFAAGELSYSKARAITRIANPQLEDSFLELARNATASQLERIVSEYRKSDPDEGLIALEKHRSRYFRSFTDREGMVVIQARLSPEDGAMVLGAIEAARACSRSERQSQEADDEQQMEDDVFAETSEVCDQEETFENVSAETRPEVKTAEMEEADALVAVCESVLSAGLPSEPEEPRVSVLLHIDEQVAKDPTSDGCSFIEGVGAISSHTALRLACDATVSRIVYKSDGSVEPQGKTRSIPRRIRRAVLTRDRGCRFPGCTQRKFVDVHHVIFWSRGGATKPSNLVSLCRFHHRRVHEGGYTLALARTGSVQVWAPDGREIPAVPTPPKPCGPTPQERHRIAGLEIDAETLQYGCNDPCDFHIAVDCLIQEARTTSFETPPLEPPDYN